MMAQKYLSVNLWHVEQLVGMIERQAVFSI